MIFQDQSVGPLRVSQVKKDSIMGPCPGSSVQLALEDGTPRRPGQDRDNAGQNEARKWDGRMEAGQPGQRYNNYHLWFETQDSSIMSPQCLCILCEP
jgi:hypothetical protein